jgi:hypothetical protein
MIEETYNIPSTNLKDFVKSKNYKNSNINTTYTNTSVNLNNDRLENINEEEEYHNNIEGNIYIPKINMTKIKEEQELNFNYQLNENKKTKYQHYNTSFDKDLFSNNFSKYTSRIRRKNTNDLSEKCEFSDLKLNFDTRQNVSSRFERKSKTNLFN